MAVGYWLTSMMGPSKCALRWLWSLTTLAMLTVKDPFVTVEPAIVSEPQISLVRPTAVALWPEQHLLDPVAGEGAGADVPRAVE